MRKLRAPVLNVFYSFSTSQSTILANFIRNKKAIVSLTLKDPLSDGKINQDGKNKIRLGVNTSFSKKRGAIATKLFKI